MDPVYKLTFAFGALIGGMIGVFLLVASTMRGTVMNGIIGGVQNIRGRADKGLRSSRGEADQGRKQRRTDRKLMKRADREARANAKIDHQRKGVRGFARNSYYKAVATGARRGTNRNVNLQGRMSARRAETMKDFQQQIDNGDDSQPRALTVNTKAALEDWKSGPQTYDQKTGMTTSQNGLMRQTADGKYQYKTLGGAWSDEADVVAAQKRWGRNQFAQQAAVAYEMKKANSEDDVEDIADRYGALAQDQWGMTGSAARGVWMGAAFQNQNKHLEYKRTKFSENAGGKLQRDKGKFDSSAFIDEIYENRGSYNMAQMHANTISTLKDEYAKAVKNNDTDKVFKIKSISETFMNDMNLPRDGEGNPTGISAQPPSGIAIPSQRRANTPGAGHVAERVSQLADLTGVRNQPLKNTPPPVTVPPDPYAGTGARNQN